MQPSRKIKSGAREGPSACYSPLDQQGLEQPHRWRILQEILQENQTVLPSAGGEPTKPVPVPVLGDGLLNHPTLLIPFLSSRCSESRFIIVTVVLLLLLLLSLVTSTALGVRHYKLLLRTGTWGWGCASRDPAELLAVPERLRLAQGRLFSASPQINQSQAPPEPSQVQTP